MESSVFVGAGCWNLMSRNLGQMRALCNISARWPCRFYSKGEELKTAISGKGDQIQLYHNRLLRRFWNNKCFGALVMDFLFTIFQFFLIENRCAYWFVLNSAWNYLYYTGIRCVHRPQTQNKQLFYDILQVNCFANAVLIENTNITVISNK